MASSPVPDLAAPRRFALTTAAVTAVVCAMLMLHAWPLLGATLGDADDALRLQRVRDLLAGEGWFDHQVDRIQPPGGGEIHWSRLVDAGLAGMLAGFDLLLGRSAAEWWTRVAWPLLWAAPTIAAALAVARRLGGGRAVTLCAVLIAPSTLAFLQFAPGRIDHHNIQIALAVTGFAGAVVGGRRGGVVSALSAAVGLAVGVEALLFHALAGAAHAMRWAADPREDRAVAAYGLVLAPTLLLLHAVQTQPSRWAEPACDALGSNLLLGAGLAALGLVVLVRLLRGASLAARLGGLAVLGAGAAAAYAGLEPACLGGPLGAADPRLGPIWLEHVEEVQTLFQTFGDEPAEALAFLAPPLTGLAALLAAFLNPRVRRDPAWLVAGAFVLLAVVAQAAASRMIFYAIWTSLPVIAAVVLMAADRFWKGRLLPAVALVLALSPFATVLAVGAAAEGLLGSERKPEPDVTGDCYSSAAYRDLGRLPPGWVLTPVYLGSHVVALTPHTTISAPYHRMDQGILSSHRALAAPPAAAEAEVRALRVQYVVTCPTLGGGKAQGADLRSVLDRGETPAWLDRVSAPGSLLNVYRVRPAA